MGARIVDSASEPQPNLYGDAETIRVVFYVSCVVFCLTLARFFFRKAR